MDLSVSELWVVHFAEFGIGFLALSVPGLGPGTRVVQLAEPQMLAVQLAGMWFAALSVSGHLVLAVSGLKFE